MTKTRNTFLRNCGEGVVLDDPLATAMLSDEGQGKVL
jgi:hypothetical protein